MKILLYFFKVVYVIRKRVRGLQTKYMLLEHRYLYGDRILFSDKFHIVRFPDFHFDQSSSRLILKQNISIRGRMDFLFFCNGIIEVGENTFFNNNCSINCFEKIVIGDNCLFGENVKLYDHNHQFSNRNQLINEQGYVTAPIIIGSNCWFGSNVTILKGVTVGDNCVIGANCLIHKDLKANSVIYKDTGDHIIKAL